MSHGNGKKQSTAEICASLAEPVARTLGVYLWDVVFEKEGAGWYLRYLIDKDGGVNIDECEAFSRQVSDLLDEKDPIAQSYCLEVSSPGIERKLTHGWHFQKYIGQQVLVRLIRPVEGVRDFVGALEAFDEEAGSVTVNLEEDCQMAFTLDETAFVRLYAQF